MSGFPFVDQRHFLSPLAPADARALFKASVVNVEMAISSYCNRRCPYCPNKDVDRRTAHYRMDDGVFLNIMRHLKDIAYSGEICLHRFNEPLADRDYALARIRQVRQFIPAAAIIIYTNGDYLDGEYLRLLGEAGIACIAATVHAPPEGANFTTLAAQLGERVRQLGRNWRLVEDRPGLRVVEIEAGPRMRLFYTARDFFQIGSDGPEMLDRGQSLDAGKTYRRDQPCLQPFTELQVEWDGTLLPCCNIHTDVAAHQAHFLGRVAAETDLFAEWTNAAYAAWRRTLFSNRLKPSPCTSCDHALLDDTPAMRQWVERTGARP